MPFAEDRVVANAKPF